MVWFSFHGGHSGSYCRHAADDLASVVERAVALGFSHYGLSEHAPRYRTEDLLDGEAGLAPHDLAASFARYAEDAVRLRERYADRIALFVGFESERLPPGEWAGRMRAVRASAPFDYMVGSVHDVDGLVIDASRGQTQAVAERLGGVEPMQVSYFSALTDLIEALRPEVVGHVDLIRKFDVPGTPFSPRVLKAVERTLEAAKAFGCVLDVNCGAWRRGLGPVYPLPAILQRAREMEIAVTLGDDSHGVASVGVGLHACLDCTHCELQHELQRRFGPTLFT